MKKINKLILSSILLIVINGCAGYEPIFGSKNIRFTISNFSVDGEKMLGNKIYSKLRNAAKSSKNKPDAQRINFFINVSKDKIATSKDSAGKILEYKIVLVASVEANNLDKNIQILKEEIKKSSSYKIQKQYSETLNIEKQTIETLIENIYQELLIKLSQNISK